MVLEIKNKKRIMNGVGKDSSIKKKKALYFDLKKKKTYTGHGSSLTPWQNIF